MLRSLADAGAEPAERPLQVLLTYPFTNQVLNDVKGDYLNVFLSLQREEGDHDHPARSCLSAPAKKGKH